MQENESKVALFWQQQALAGEAAQQGLIGLARVADHASIIARMERGAERMIQLISEGKHEEAQAIMETSWWLEGLEEGASLCHTPTPS